jgi:hypothetical protein
MRTVGGMRLASVILQSRDGIGGDEDGMRTHGHRAFNRNRQETEDHQSGYRRLAADCAEYRLESHGAPDERAWVTRIGGAVPPY